VQAQAKFGSLARFLVADMTQRLPFPDQSFDAVMSNVAMHMFPDGVTRAVFAQVGRLVCVGGVFVFHVNSLEDRPLRARNLPARELEPDYVAEASGQTMHFFSEAHLRELLAGWRQVELVPVPIHKTGEPFKHVWRGIAAAERPPQPTHCSVIQGCGPLPARRTACQGATASTRAAERCWCSSVSAARSAIMPLLLTQAKQSTRRAFRQQEDAIPDGSRPLLLSRVHGSPTRCDGESSGGPGEDCLRRRGRSSVRGRVHGDRCEASTIRLAAPCGEFARGRS
jgi:Methyltransferase domain